MSGFAPPGATTEHPTIIPLAQLESLIGGDLGVDAMHLDAVMASPSEDGAGPSAPAQISPPLNRPDNAWVRFEAEVRSKHAVALMRLRRLWETGVAAEDVQPLLRLLEIEEYTRCQAFQACVMGEERSHVYQAAVRSIIEKLLGKLETHYPSFYQAAAGCLSDYMSALNHHCEICVVPPPPSALPAIAEGSAHGYADSASQMTGYSSEGHSEASRSEDTLSVCSNRVDGPDTQHGYLIDGSVDGRGRASSGGALRSAEERVERRRESNKKAASRYRNKKQASQSSLMTDNSGLRQQVTTLTSQVAVLSAENKLLSQQVGFLQQMLSGRSGADVPIVGSSSSSSAALQPPPPAAAAPEVCQQTSETRAIEMLLDSLPPGTGLHDLERSLNTELPHIDQHIIHDQHGSSSTGLPSEERCAKAFGAATSADIDLLGFS